MAEIYSNSYLINDLHFSSNFMEDWVPGAKYAFFIHSTVFANCEKMLEMNSNDDAVWNFPLQIGAKCFDMKLIFLTINEEEMYDCMQQLVWSAQYSFVWEDQATLYKSTSSYHKLEEFIMRHNLKSAIKKIDEIESISVERENIKVITFAKCIDKSDLNMKYRKFISSDHSAKPNYHYFTVAFPWYQQPLLEHLTIPVENHKINTVLPIILRHLYYSNSINMFDLIATKLAICDFRHPEHTYRLQNEIDSLVQLTLRKTTYIKNNIFDFVQYSTDRNFIPTRSCILYFVYTFQNYFDAIRIVFRDEIKARPDILNFSIMKITIKLAEQLDEIGKICDRTNIKFKIDGTGFDRMTFPLFLDLLELDNVYEIILDTNYVWATSGEINKNYQINAGNKVTVKLFGSNPLNFIEELVGFLKTFIHSTKLRLRVNCALESYMIFDNLEISCLEFYRIHIDHKLLDELNRCNLRDRLRIHIEFCTLENTIENWELMMGLKQLRSIEIEEDDGTWQFMFDYISKCLINSNSNEFKFNKLVAINTSSDSGNIDFDEIRFIMDEDKSRLLLKNCNTQEVRDLYDLKFRYEFDEIDDYDFYQ